MDPSSSTASSSTAAPESRPQAGPLPRKRGEIGFTGAEDAQEGRSSPAATALPERHPEDRGAPQPTTSAAAPSTPAIPASPSSNTLATSSTCSLHKQKRIFGFLKPKEVPSYGGLRLTTLLAFGLQCIFVAGTIVGWAFATMRSNRTSGSNSSVGSSQGAVPNNPVFGGASTAIFIHVVFGVATLVQLLFVERRVFRLRAERYSFLHPGEILPSAHRRAMGDPSIGLSPWNRPPLPTYAAALAQSGVGTGDVEDHLIAAPPPPAYGNTRGSTFLLSGFLRESLRAQRPVSAQTQAAQNAAQPPMAERPKSYVSVDEDWEEIQDAERARRLEETLATLERPAAAR
ncbi:hypothetical protein B0H15DRAFT_808192 [Mycena belliarum]|uniref:Transmembrane protein n=1 Tax=Mycena belliarum TaxID=1033014 RepID=A0AAD6XWG6_9AGAR|nr:hypothetical protein B0H15DRAFT_808192 [Mycena belliae]